MSTETMSTKTMSAYTNVLTGNPNPRGGPGGMRPPRSRGWVGGGALRVSDGGREGWPCRFPPSNESPCCLGPATPLPDSAPRPGCLGVSSRREGAGPAAWTCSLGVISPFLCFLGSDESPGNRLTFRGNFSLSPPLVVVPEGQAVIWTKSFKGHKATSQGQNRDVVQSDHMSPSPPGLSLASWSRVPFLGLSSPRNKGGLRECRQSSLTGSEVSC